MQDDRDTSALLKWLAVAVPGLSAGIGWAAAEGYPPLARALCGVAAGVTIYALLHWLLKGGRRNRS
jgi:hypothetical protein